MTIKILAVAFLALALTACETSTENANNSNENRPAATSPAATPATIPSPASTPAASPAASTTQLKAGDKVKVTLNGTSSEATVVSVDNKTGKATVKIQGQKEDKTVALSAVSKQ
jgi:sRNA-binding protein